MSSIQKVGFVQAHGLQRDLVESIAGIQTH